MVVREMYGQPYRVSQGLVIRNGDAVGLSGGLVSSRQIEDTVGINDLQYTTRNARRLEFTKKIVIVRASTFTFAWMRTSGWLSE